MTALESFLKPIRDWRMETPVFYGAFHLIWLGAAAVGCALVILLRRKITPKAMDVTLIVWGAVLIVLEVLKQLLVSCNYTENGVVWSYAWWAFPYQFCSCPLFVALPAGILKKGKLKTALLNFLSVYALFAGLIVMFYPANVFSGMAFLSYHSMLWHSSMVVVCLALHAGKIVNPSLKSLLSAAAVFAAMSVVALILNIALGDKVNLFYISPYVPFNVPIVKLIWESVPFPVYFVLYLFGFSLAAGIVFSAAYGITKLSRIIKLKIRKPNENI